LSASLPSRRFWRIVLALLGVVVTWLALVPVPPPQADLGWDKLNHIAAFAVLAAVAAQAVAGRARIVGALMAYGVFIEIAQSFIPPRSGDWRDLVGDAVGVAIGLLLAAAVAKVRRLGSRGSS
jgi:VanZ family protein